MKKTDYVSVKEASTILGSTRQNIHYLRKHGILKDFIQVANEDLHLGNLGIKKEKKI